LKTTDFRPIDTKWGKQMKSWNYWQQFTRTGSVRDYLEYVQMKEERCEMPQKENAGVQQDAGICVCNRNNIEADACR